MKTTVALTIASAMTIVSLTSIAGEPEKKGPPFGDAPKAADEPKPAERTWTVKSGEYLLSVLMKPGVPDPDQATEVTITASLVPKTPNPRYGNRVPVENASVVVDVQNPAGEVVHRIAAHQLPLSSSKYGMHLTPSQAGLYTLSIKGTTEDGKPIAGELKLPVKVWPLPQELKGGGDDDKGRRPIKG
jgi:hypothetical protein